MISNEESYFNIATLFPSSRSCWTDTERAKQNIIPLPLLPPIPEEGNIHSILTIKRYIQVMQTYLIECVAYDGIDINQPLPVMILAGVPGDAIRMLRMLQGLREYPQFEDISMHFFIVAPTSNKSARGESTIDEIARHPEVLPLVEAKQCSISNTIADFIADHFPGNNPMVVLELNWLAQYPQTLMFMHYGEIYQGTAFQTAKADENVFSLDHWPQWRKPLAAKQPKLGSQWSLIEDLEQWLQSFPAEIQPQLKQQIHAYQRYLHHQPIMLPIEAMQQVQLLSSWHRQGLWLSSGQGCQNPDAYLQTEEPKDWAEMFNWEPIQNVLGEQAKVLSHQERSPEGVNTSIETFGVFTQEATEEERFKMTEHAFYHHQCLHSAGIQTQLLSPWLHDIKSMNSATARFVLDQSGFAPCILQAYLPTLQSEGIPVRERSLWCQTLDQVWENYVPLQQNLSFAASIAELSLQWCHWPLAKRALLTLMMAMPSHVELLSDLLDTAIATADRDLVGLVKQALSLHEASEDIQSLQTKVKDWHDMSRGFAWEEMLHLEPLDIRHARAFWLQYADPDIPTLTRTYVIDGLSEVRQLIESMRQDKARDDFAVIHPCFGFIGVTSLERFEEESAHFSFWIGKDFQNQGYGTDAARLCIEQAQKLGFIEINTSAWQHNHRSRHVLKQLGFVKSAEQGEGIEREVIYQLFIETKVLL